MESAADLQHTNGTRVIRVRTRTVTHAHTRASARLFVSRERWPPLVSLRSRVTGVWDVFLAALLGLVYILAWFPVSRHSLVRRSCDHLVLEREHSLPRLVPLYIQFIKPTQRDEE